MIHSGRDEQHASITRIDSNLTPVKQPFKRTAASCEQYSDLSDGIAKYDYNQIEKEFARDSFLTAIPVVTTDPKMVDESMNGFTVHWQKTTDCRFSEHLAGSSAYPLNQQWQQYRSTPDLCQMQLNHREVPEQLYHLYETQDAFGNLLAQL